MKTLTFALLIFILSQLHGGFVTGQTPDLQDYQAGTNETLDRLIADTLRLLKLGDDEITLLPEYRDLILVVGNTGAGKSTLTKFLTDQPLVSYFTPSGFLIMDREGAISNSTLISQSLLPQLMIHNETNTAFYDLPGFSDTRNESVEIANAFFMKKVADHARSVKLLFVVNHFSLTAGMDRSDFLKMARQSVDFVKTMDKFKPGISLIASKVNHPWNDTLVTAGIVYFLETAMNDLPALIPDEVERASVTSLIRAFITQLSANDKSFARIGLFRVPDREGPITEIPVIMDSRPQMDRILWNNTAYVPKTEDDFGLSLSADALLVVTQVISRVVQDLGCQMVQLSSILQNHYIQLLDSVTFGHIDLFTVLQKVSADAGILTKMTEDLKGQASKNDRRAFLSVLESTFILTGNDLSVKGKVKSTVDEILRLSGQLDFFEGIQSEVIAVPLQDWAFSVNTTVTTVKSRLGQSVQSAVTGTLNAIKSTMSTLGTSIENSYRALIQKVPGTGALTPAYTCLHTLHVEYNMLQVLVKEVTRPGLARQQFESAIRAALVTGRQWTITTLSKGPVDTLAKFGGHLDLLEKIGGTRIPGAPTEWAVYLSTATGSLKTETVRLARNRIDKGIQSALEVIGSSLYSAYKNVGSYQFSSAKQVLLVKDYNALNGLKSKLMGFKVLKDFSTANWGALNALSVKWAGALPVWPASGLQVDLDDMEPNVYNVKGWASVLNSAVGHLEVQWNALKGQRITEKASPQMTNWGEWASGFSDCGTGFVGGMQLRVAPPNDKDMTALNTIRFFCTGAGVASNSGSRKTIASLEGPAGAWKPELFCSGTNKAVGFELRTEGPRPDVCHQECKCHWSCPWPGHGCCGTTTCWDVCNGQDDSAANNLNLICEDGKTLVGNGGARGVLTGVQKCDAGQFLCGIKTQVEKPNGDNTALNNLKVHCCNIFHTK